MLGALGFGETSLGDVQYFLFVTYPSMNARGEFDEV